MQIKYVVAGAFMVWVSFSGKAQESSQRVDPTRPPEAFLALTESGGASVMESVRTLRLNLQSVWYVEGAARATINNEIYRLGDRIGEWNITDIDVGSVTLQKQEEIMHLTVFEQGQMSISRDPS